MTRRLWAVLACVCAVVLADRGDGPPGSQPQPRVRLDNPGAAVAWRNLSLRDENGMIAEDGLMRAKAHVDAMRAQPARPSDAGIAPGTWTSLGPGNVGGRIRSIVIHPTTTDTMFVGSVSGGIWRTNNGGQSWSPVNDFLANLAVCAIVMTPGTPSTMYAATGEGFYNGDGIRGAGVFKSVDGGVTWSQLQSTSSAPSTGLTAADFHYMTELAISPDAGTLIATTTTGIFRSIDAGATFARGSTAGISASAIGLGFVDVQFHPTDSTRAVVGTYGGTALYTVDGGATWQLASGLPGGSNFRRVELAYARTNPNIVYAGVDLNQGTLYKSSNGGQTYVEIWNGENDQVNPYFAQGWYDNLLWVSPTDENFLVWGGLGLHRSTTGGTSWTPISSTGGSSLVNPTSPHVDQHVAVAHPGFNGTTNRTIYIGNDGGLYRATDIALAGGQFPYTTSWSELNNGLGITQFYGGAGHPGTGRVLGGTQDNGTPFYNPSNTNASENWVDVFPNFDGGLAAYDPIDANLFYGEVQYLEIFRNTGTPGTASATFIASRTNPNGLLDAGDALKAEFVAPFILDPHDSNTLIAGGTSVWRSRNVKAASPQFEAIRTASAGATFQHITTIAAARNSGTGRSNVIWIGESASTGSSVYRTISAAGDDPIAVRSTWSRVGASSLPTRRVTRITIDPTNTNIVYVAFGGFSADNLWKTTDGGASWTDITGSSLSGLPDVPVRDLEIHPSQHNWLYVATEVGLFTSEDGGATWKLPADGPAYVSVDELFFLGTTLHAVTHGRGIFRTATNNTLTGPSLTTIADRTTFTSTPVSASFTVSDPDTPLANLTVTATSSNTNVIPASGIAFSGAGSSRTITLTPTGTAGSVIISVTVSDGTDRALRAFRVEVQSTAPTISPLGDITLVSGSSAIVQFTVSDPDTPLSNLGLSGTVVNTQLVPQSGLTFSGTDSARTLRITPTPGQSGSTQITITVSDGVLSSSSSFIFTVGSNSGPTISEIANQTITSGASATVAFTIADPDTPLSSLTLSVSSSDTTLIPSSALVLGGSGGNRTVTITPAPSQAGNATVTIVVSDGVTSASRSFTVTVTSAGTTGPTISTIANQSVIAGSGLTLNFSVTDPDTPLANLTLTGESSNAAIIPPPAIVFGGSGTNRTVTLSTTAGQAGTLTITIRVSDGTSTASTSFTVTVANNLPLVGAPSNLAATVAGNTVILAWIQGAGQMSPTSYLLEGGLRPGSTLGSLPLPATSTTFTVTLPTGIFYLRLFALAGTARSAASNEVLLYVNVPRPPLPPNNLLGLVNGSALALSWRNAVDGGTPDAIVLDVAGAVTASVPLPVSETFSFDGVPAGTYTFSVRAANSTATSAASNSVTLTFPGGCSGVPLAPVNFTAAAVRSTVTVSWQPPATGPAVTGYTLIVTGAFTGNLPMTTRTLSGTAPPGSYTFSVRAVNACGESTATSPQTITIP